MTKIIVARESLEDKDKKLFGTYVGFDDRNKTLLCTVWGNTAEQSRMRALSYAKLLNKVLDDGGIVRQEKTA